MKIKWWGHACFSIRTADNTTILTDPYPGNIGYASITEAADIVTVSHDHFDHNAVDKLSGNPLIIKTTGKHKAAGITITGITSFHDNVQGSKRGSNIIYVIEADGWRLAHFGDLGTALTTEQLQAIGQIDIVMIPVGGHYTIDAQTAFEQVQAMKPKVVLPMHYKTEVLDFPIQPVTAFTELFDSTQVRWMESAEITLESLPQDMMVYVLQYVK